MTGPNDVDDRTCCPDLAIGGRRLCKEPPPVALEKLLEARREVPGWPLARHPGLDWDTRLRKQAPRGPETATEPSRLP